MNSLLPPLVPAKLVDSFGRDIHYLRLSVTDRCNFRCLYCMAEQMTFLPKSAVLSFEEIEFVAKQFVALGIRKIRLTGGEPTVRQGIVELAQSLAAIEGLQELTLTTNGAKLSELANPLVHAGVKRVNISIDSLQSDRFKSLTRTGDLQPVLAGIDAAVSAGFEKVKLNAVIMEGFNDDEVISLAQFAIDRGVDISFIEEMPLGHVDSHQRRDTQTASSTIQQQLHQRFTLSAIDYQTGGPSRYYQVANTSSKIGFISPISDNFCASCNRVRLTAEGLLLLCLGNEHSLDIRNIIRNQPLDAQRLRAAIMRAMQRKPERHHFDPEQVDIVRFMNMTGG